MLKSNDPLAPPCLERTRSRRVTTARLRSQASSCKQRQLDAHGSRHGFDQPDHHGSRTINAVGPEADDHRDADRLQDFLQRSGQPGKGDDYGAAGAPADVTFTGATNGPIPGTLVFSADDKTAWFNATGGFLVALNNGTTAALPNDTYTVTLVSATAPNANGFQDAGAGLGLDNGSGGHGNFTGGFTVTNGTSPMLGIADFARGPNAASDTTTIVKVPNKTGVGIPVTLYSAAGVKTATFTVTYNSQILTITGGVADPSNAGATFTMTGTPVLGTDGIHSTATFSYSSATAAGAATVLGDITGFVPNSAKNKYQVKDLVALSNIAVTGGATTTVNAGSGVDINAYFADVNGDHHIDALDKALLANVASGSATGFPAFTMAPSPPN